MKNTNTIKLNKNKTVSMDLLILDLLSIKLNNDKYINNKDETNKYIREEISIKNNIFSSKEIRDIIVLGLIDKKLNNRYKYLNPN